MSRSSVLAERLSTRSTFRKCAGIAFIVLTGIYLVWRVTVFSERDFGFSLLFYLAEVICYLMAVVSICCCWSYRHREPKEPEEGVSVDIFLPVYKEPFDMIRLTVLAAKKSEYPHRVLLLDDGKRDELRELAKDLDVHYLRREGNLGAKAGNMNHALDYSDAEFILVLDADHIIQPEGLGALLGLVEDGVGLVQAPQEYYNTDALQYMHSGEGRLWHDQSRFYNVVQACKDVTDSASSCGTGVLYRRKAVDEIGGFPELSVTEDMHTSIRMHQRAWKSVYLNEPIAYGVAAGDLADYYRTRQRWAHGNLHVIHKEKPWLGRGLTWKQRFFYCELGIIYLECWQQFLMFLVPVITLCFGLQPFDITLLNVAVILLFPLSMLVLLDEQGCGMTRSWTSQLFAIARMPIQMISWSGFFGKKIGWNPSVKNVEGELKLKLILPQLFLFALCLIGLAVGSFRLSSDPQLGPLTALLLSAIGMGDSLGSFRSGDIDGYSLDLFLVSAFWAGYNLLRTGFWVLDAYKRSLKTNEHFRFTIPLIFETGEGDLVNVSWISQSEMAVDDVWMNDLNDGDYEGKLWLPAGPLAVVFSKGESKDGALTFKWRDQGSLDSLCFALYSVDWHAEMKEREGYFPTLIERAGAFLRRIKRPNLRDWRGALGEFEGSRFLCVTSDGDDCQILGFRDFRESQTIALSYPGGVVKECVLGEQVELQGWCRKSLDGTVRWRRRAIMG